jgi:hypothetical protein
MSESSTNTSTTQLTTNKADLELTLLIETEKTKQAQEKTKQKQAEEKTKQKQAEEKTKQEVEKTKQEVEKTKQLKRPVQMQIKDEVATGLDHVGAEGIDYVAIDLEKIDTIASVSPRSPIATSALDNSEIQSKLSFRVLTLT